MSNPVIELTQQPFALGGNRACYVHPDNELRCIKTILSERSPERKHQAAPWWKKWRSVDSFNDNIEENHELKTIEQRSPELIGQHIPRCYGFIETNLGLGLLTDLYRDQDGSISLNLRDYLRSHGKTQVIMAAIARFQTAIQSHQVLSRALLLHNIIAQQNSDGQVQLFLIDGLGNPEFLPFAEWIPALRAKKIQRKMVKMDHHVDVIASGGEL